MAYDLSRAENSGILVQMCGDAHVQNLGAYAGDDGRLIFDINDFDETARGPFEWEIKRMATSILLAGREAKLKRATVEEAAGAFLTSYCALIRMLLPMPVLEVARFQVHRLRGVAPISKILGKAERATPCASLQALTTASPTGRVFKSDPPLLKRVDGPERRAVLASLEAYRESLLPERRHFLARFRPIDVGFKVVGTGSIGLRNYILYLEGNGEGDPLFLQFKQQPGSCWAPYLAPDADARKQGQNQGRRVAEGQRAMQLQSDPLLGWTRIGRFDYLVRQLNDHKASITVDRLTDVDLLQYASVCGEILARGHARSGDVREIAASIGKGRRFSKAILRFAEAYAAQVERDWKAFSKSRKRGQG